jgi:hypothetical protein
MMFAGADEQEPGQDDPREETDAAAPSAPPRVVVRVATPGQPAFQLRKGEQGLSVFDLQSIVPAVTEAEILAAFQTGSVALTRTVDEIKAAGLELAAVPGDPKLPPRLQQAHAEIVPGPGMTRNQFKTALKGLE